MADSQQDAQKGRPAEEDRYLGFLVCLVYLVKQDQQDEQNKSDRPNEQDGLADFFSILLEIHPELEIRPVLIGASTQVLLDIGPGKHMAIDRLKG